jgi:hypothetical protein
MAKNTVYRFLDHCQGREPVLQAVKEKSRERRITGRISALATVLDRRSGRSAALPYPPSSAEILSCVPIFATGRFFDVKMAGFSL